jgi:hypothetical protein
VADCDNIWKEMKHCRVGGAFHMTLPFDCPADHIIPLVNWFDENTPITFREPGFLTDPRLSPEIKQSWQRVAIPPLTADEARTALAPYVTHARTSQQRCASQQAAVSHRCIMWRVPLQVRQGAHPRDWRLRHALAVARAGDRPLLRLRGPRQVVGVRDTIEPQQRCAAALHHADAMPLQVRGGGEAAGAVLSPLLLRGRLQGAARAPHCRSALPWSVPS